MFPLGRVELQNGKKLKNSSLIERAYWLTPSQQDIILKTIDNHQLDSEHSEKLLGILSSIPFAERQIRLKGKAYLNQIEAFLSLLKIKHRICSSLGSWNFNVCHAARFGYDKRSFSNLLIDDIQAARFVSVFIIEDIGLDKPISHIFAEYNLNLAATALAALQKAYNIFARREALLIDGLLGEDTLKAYAELSHILNLPLNLTEKGTLLLLKKMEESLGIAVKPFIPTVKIKMDFNFLKKCLLTGCKSPKELLKISHVLNNHIDVPLYVEEAMSAYQHVIGSN